MRAPAYPILAHINGDGHISTKSGTRDAQRRREAEIAQLAARQHGVAALAQLRDLGLSASGVRSRVAAGRLHRLHPGVYAVGHPLLSARGRWMAAVLACGPRAVLSHRSAAALWGLLPSSRAAIDVAALSRPARDRAWVDVHRAGTLESDDVTRVDGIPCTSVARTLLDLAGVVERRSVERAYEQAEVLGVLDVSAVEAVLTRSFRRPGSAVLRGIVSGARPGESLTRSELEERFLAICGAAALPRPRVNAWVRLGDGDGVEVDFVWPEQRLIVETDGHRVHRTRQAFERDRARDRRLLLAGWMVVRFTWRQLVNDNEEVVATLRALLECQNRA
ncbi:MAG: type IV toxin-antitoxin system AbiEi family antitoxin domain-containing protein [Solirubrobacterales bacterium]